MADVLGTYSFLATPDVNGTLVLLNSGNTPSILADTLANRPAFGVAGRLFVDTTNNVWQRDTGTAWITIGSAGGSVASVTGTANQIAVTGTSINPIVGLASNAIMPGTASLTLPVGTTAQRPGSPSAGMVRYNSDLARTEVYRGTAWISPVGILDKSVVSQVVTTNAVTEILNFTVPGGTLGTSNLIRVRISGLWANASGANRQVTIGILYGGTTIWQDLSGSLTTGNDTGWNMDLILSSNASVNSQTLNGVIQIGGTGAVAAGITGDLGSDEILSNAILTGTSAVASGSNQSFVVRVSFNGTGITWTKYFHTIEVM